MIKRVNKLFLVILVIFRINCNTSLPGWNDTGGYESIGSVSWTNNDLRSALYEFAFLYQKRPIKNNECGMNSAHMFYCWYITRKLKPKFIIESGVWRGQSTWLFEQAAPQSQIISIDPKLDFRIYISSKVKYETKDFSVLDWSKIDKDNTLCFFDDHQGFRRIRQSYSMGFKHILYEDNYPLPGGNFTNDLAVKVTLSANNEDALWFRKIAKVYYRPPT